MASRRLAVSAGRLERAVRSRLAQDLARLCQDAAVSQPALAAAAGVSQPYISRILDGSARPSFMTYARLAAALGADLNAHVYPNTGPAIRDRLSVPILEALLDELHPRWRPFTEVRVHRPGRGWIDVVLHEVRERVLVASEVVSALRRIEQLVRWSTEKADSLASWDRWPDLDAETRVSRLLVVRWTRSNRQAAKAASRQLRIAYPAHPDDALEALTGTAAWPGPALLWARDDSGLVRLVGGR